MSFCIFLYVARGSCGEVRAQLYVATDQNFISSVDFERLKDEADHTSRLLFNLITAYKKKSYGGQRHGDDDFGDRQEFDEYLKRVVEEGKKKVTQCTEIR